MSNVIASLEKVLLPFAVKIGKQPHVNAIKNGFIRLMPLTLAGYPGYCMAFDHWFRRFLCMYCDCAVYFSGYLLESGKAADSYHGIHWPGTVKACPEAARKS